MDSMILPGKWNLYDFTELPDFDNWDLGAKAIQDYENKKSEIEGKKTISLLIILGSIAGMMFGAVVDMSLFFICLILIIVFSKLRKGLQKSLATAQSDFRATWYKHTDIFIRPLINSFSMTQWNSYRASRKCLIYNDQKFIYFDVDEEILVVCDKQNIKEVSRERLHVGASTTGNSRTVGGASTIGNSNVLVGGAQTSSSSNTQNFYEWHFDIFINFISYPKISFLLEDSHSVEEFVGRAYAVLKP